MILSPAPNTAGGNSRFNFQTAKDDSGGEPSLRAQRSNPSCRAKKRWIASSLRSSQKPSYSAKAEYPVRRGFSTPSLAPWNTGSPAGACHRAAIRPTRWRAMTVGSVMRSYRKRTFTTSPRHAPEALLNLPPIEGVGNAGCPLHPRPRVHLVVVERTRVTTSTPESPGVPARNGFTAYFVLLCPQNLPECANGRLIGNRPSLDLSPFVLEGL